MSPLEQYKQLINQYYDIIKVPGDGWVEGRKPLIEKMDKIWDKLSKQEQDWLKDVYSRGLYEALISQ
jgi:hypothetical protein